MAYTVENGLWRAVFAAPCDIVDSHLKLIGEVPLKVLLALLRYNGDLGVSSLSAIVGRPEPVIKEALEYLLREGLVKNPDFAEPKLAVPAVPTISAKVDESKIDLAEKERKISRHSTMPRGLTYEEITGLAESDEAVSWLLQEAQVVLGRTLRQSETAILVELYSNHGMKPDIVMMVLQYCVGIEKTTIGYIDKVAKDWLAAGIETHEQAEKEIKRRNEQQSNEGKVKRAFGIYDRALVPNEKKYVHAWFNELGVDIPLITLAFERTVEVKGKLSFSYINGILKNWHMKGITSPAEAMRDMREKSPEAAKNHEAQKPVNASSYDLSELEALLNQGAL